MAGKSLPPVSAKVIADIEQFVSEFKRAENVARRTTDNINRELGDFAKKAAKKFEFGDVAKDVFKGAGLFGGFQIAQTASELIAGHFKDAAESAERLAVFSERSLKSVQEAIKAGRTDAQNLAALKAEQDRQQREVDGFWKEREAQAARSGRRVNVREITPAQTENLERIKAEMQEREVAIRAAEKKETDRTASEAVKAIESDYNRRTKALAEGLQQQEKAFDSLIETQKKANEATARTREEAAKLAEKYKDLADPTRTFTRQMAEAEAMAAAGKISFEEAARAVLEQAKNPVPAPPFRAFRTDKVKARPVLVKPEAILEEAKTVSPEEADRYEKLMGVLMDAYSQASAGKGDERHSDGQAFEDQDMMKVMDRVGADFALGQVIKKCVESRRLPRDARRKELLGAIVYLAGAIIWHDMGGKA